MKSLTPSGMVISKSSLSPSPGDAQAAIVIVIAAILDFLIQRPHPWIGAGSKEGMRREGAGVVNINYIYYIIHITGMYVCMYVCMDGWMYVRMDG